MSTKIVYTAIPKYLHFAHDYILRYVISQGNAPVTPYAGAFWLLDTVDREQIRNANKAYIKIVDEMWVFGIQNNNSFNGWKINDLHVTDEVIENVKSAKEEGISIRLHAVDTDRQTIVSLSELDTDNSISVSNTSEQPNLF